MIYILKANFLHRIGNIVQAFLSIIDNIIIICTFGFIYTNFSLLWIKYRLGTKLYQQKK